MTYWILLVLKTPDQAAIKQTLAKVTVLCSWMGQLMPAVPLLMWGYQWVHVLVSVLWWHSIPSKDGK